MIETILSYDYEFKTNVRTDLLVVAPEKCTWHQMEGHHVNILKPRKDILSASFGINHHRRVIVIVVVVIVIVVVIIIFIVVVIVIVIVVVIINSTIIIVVIIIIIIIIITINPPSADFPVMSWRI